MWWPFTLRAFHDGFAVDVHLITVFVMVYYSAPFETHPVSAAALAVMQGSSVIFHLFYVLRHVLGYLGYTGAFDNVHNQYKWFEFAISATAGTVAVLSVEHVDLSVVVPISCAAVLQQLGGMLLDYQPPKGLKQEILTWVRRPGDSFYPIIVPFIGAWILQATEFYFAIDRGGPTTLKITYIVFWSTFGVHCGLALYAFEKPNWPRYNSPVWVETMYSCLGWTAKIAVFAVEWAYLNGLTLSMLSFFYVMHAALIMVIGFTAYQNSASKVNA